VFINLIRRTFFITLKLVAVLSVIVLLIGVWIYTGPRTVPFLAGYITKEISAILPQGSSFTLEKVTLEVEDNSGVVLKLINAKLHNDTKGDVELTELKARIDLLGLLPQSNHNLLNIQISQPKFQLIQLLYDGKSDVDAQLPIEKINEYINKYRDKLLKFSLMLSNTELNFEINSEESLDIQVNTLVLSPHIQNHKMVFVLYGDINIRDKNSIVDVTFDTSSGKYLESKGTISNISTSLFEEFGFPIAELKGSHVEADLSFDSQMYSPKKIEKLEFEIGNFEGKINKNHFFPVDITPENVNIKGQCLKNCTEIHIWKFQVKADYLDLNSSFSLKRIKNDLILQGEFELNSLPVDHVKDYWPIPVTARTREWIFEHISGGDLTQAQGKFNLNIDEIISKKKINKKDIIINLKLDKTNVGYMDGVPNVEDVNANIIITGEDVKFKIASGKMLGTKIITAEGFIPDLANSKSRVEVKADVVGSLQDLVDLAHAHAEIKNEKYKDLQGIAQTKVDVVVPIQDEDLTLKDINLFVTSRISKASAHNIYKDFDIKDGVLNAVYKNHNANIVGTAIVGDKYPVDINANINFINDSQKISVKTKMNWDDVAKLGYPKPEYFNNGFTVGVNLEENQGVSAEYIDLDLGNSTIYIKKLGIKKKIGDPGYIRFTMNEKADHIEIPKYELDFGTFASEGNGKLSKDLKDVIFINSTKTKLGKSSFNFNYKISDKKDVLNVVGESLDLSSVSFGGGSDSTPANGTTDTSDDRGVMLFAKVGKLFMKNDVVLNKPNLEVNCSVKRCETVRLIGDFATGGYLKLEMKYPDLNVNSNNAGNVVKALGISEKLENGILHTTGKFTDNKFKGEITINTFQLRKAPVLAKILSIVSITVTSFEGISSLVSNSGVKFEKLVCPVEYENGVLTIKDCGAKGNTLALTANGTINLKKDNINIEGVVVPENIVNQVLKSVPILKDIFGNKTENEAIGANFTITGSTDDPEVRSNPLSLLTPGFLRNIFGKF